jgi:ATP-binding cassette, subfamily B, bacterial
MTASAGPDSYPLKRLLHYAKPHRRQIWLASLFSVLNQLFDLAPPYLIGIAVDTVIQKQNSLIAQLGIPSVTGQLAFLSLATLIIWGGESLFQYAYDTRWRNLAQTVQHELRLDAYGHLQDLEMSFFEERSSGQLLSVLNDDINQLERFLDSGANELLQFATTVLTVSLSFMTLAPGVAIGSSLRRSARTGELNQQSLGQQFGRNCHD